MRGVQSLSKDAQYRICIDRAITSARHIQELATLDRIPTLTRDGSRETCVVDAAAMQKVLENCEGHIVEYEPLYRARKDRCASSALPALEIDATMPQHMSTDLPTLGESTEEYPVWYFFYGVLQDADTLSTTIDCEEEPLLERAWVLGAKRGLYNGTNIGMLSTYDPQDRVEGRAYLVKSQQIEDELRELEAEFYEVVTCQIHIEGQDIRQGRTFRFCRADLLEFGSESEDAVFAWAAGDN